MNILKKWWFWGIIAIIIVMIASSLGNEDDKNISGDELHVTTAQDKLVTTQKPEVNTSVIETTHITTTAGETTNAQTTSLQPSITEYKEGTYKVGADIPAGEYKVFSANGQMDAYIEVSKDAKANLDSITANALFKSFIYITVQEGQYLKIRDCYAVPVDQAPLFTPEEGQYTDGMYKVGTDIPKGEYKVSVNENAQLKMGYVEVTKDSTLTLDSIITNELVEGNTYIEIEEGQYLSLRDAFIKVSG